MTVVLFLAAICGVIISGMPSGPTISLPWSHDMTVKAQLADADALQPKAAVQVAGVKVGEVKAIDIQGDHALVTLTLGSATYDIHRDARVLLRPHGLFGPKYIDLVPGSARSPKIADGATLPKRQSTQPVDLGDVLQELQAPEQHQLKTFLTEFGKAAAGQGDDVNHLLNASVTLTKTLDSPVANLDNVSPQLSDMLVQNESFNADFSQTPLDQLVANSNATLRAFATNSDHLQSLLVYADDTLTQLDAGLNGRSGQIRATLEQLPSTIDKLQKFTDELGLFGRNLTGKDKTVPGDTNVTSGLIAAIENPKSAFSSYDCRVPGPVCPENQRMYYLHVRAFNLNAPLTDQTSAACNLPIFGTPVLKACPLQAGYSTQDGGAATVSGGNGAPPGGTDLATMASFLGS
ncbi:MAG: MlaD family protein [Candidatus Dormibacteria bacterium]